jgi:hypothetical protein
VVNGEKWFPRRADPLSAFDGWGVATGDDPSVWIIPASPNLDQQDAGLICAGHNNALQGERFISVGAVINEGLQPFVEMTLGSESVQMTIPQARVQLRVLQEETEAAISEAILLMFIETQLGYDYAVQALTLFRAYRKEFNK